MPFITPDRREMINRDVRLGDQAGDLCYYFYMKFMTEWKESRRWTTAHNLYKRLVVNTDHFIEIKDTKYTIQDKITALHLAWQVFFVKEVMVYEEEKIEENGDIQ